MVRRFGVADSGGLPSEHKSGAHPIPTKLGEQFTQTNVMHRISNSKQKTVTRYTY